MYITEKLLSLYPFRTLYIADLNAIMKNNDNFSRITTICDGFPYLSIWLDQGYSGQHFDYPGIVPVIGTESLSPAFLPCFREMSQAYILSLDFSKDVLNGPDEILTETSLWPERIIIMSLDRVGSGRGPDFKRIALFRSKWPEKKIIAAGGVRNEKDLEKLAALEVNAVLVASALHSKAISVTCIARVMGTDG